MSTFKSSVTLSNFYSPSSLLGAIFRPQGQYPEFFESNLVDPNRVIYRFVDTSTNNSIRVFYYQLFRVCFDLKPSQLLEQREYLKEFRAVVLDDRFRIKCNQKESVETQRLNNSMFKPLIKEFFETMEKNPSLRFQKVISNYPILDNIFLNVFKTFLSDFQVLKNFDGQMRASAVIEGLANIFDMAVTRIGQCYRFDEADIFCYVESEKELYVAAKGAGKGEVSCSVEHLAEEQPLWGSDCNKENMGNTQNVTPKKSEQRVMLISTGVIQQEPSSISSDNHTQSLSKLPPVQDFTDINYQLSQSSLIQKCPLSPSLSPSLSPQPSTSTPITLSTILHPTPYQPPLFNYQDFTSTLVLQIIHQPHRQNIRALKDRAKHRKGLCSPLI